MRATTQSHPAQVNDAKMTPLRHLTRHFVTPSEAKLKAFGIAH
jgi:hypothetical protein